MQGDFTRDTFDPGKHYSRVLMQQGRVQLDADWNEQTSILLSYMRTLAKDIFGAHAGPAADLGFHIIGKDTVDRDARIGAMEPDPTRAQALIQAANRGDAVIGPGRYYVDGIMVQNDRPVLYTEQPGYPFDAQTTVEAIADWEKAMLLYLDVWERQVTYVEDDHIREAALGGPDTCSRAQVVWQLKVLLQPDGGDVLECRSVNLLPALGTGRLRARARMDRPPTELCVIPPESRYRGENQLYRVEVHRGGSATTGPDTATFKWSHDNASATFPIRTLSGGTVTLEHFGRDAHLGLKDNDWVEIVDDSIAMGSKGGSLAQITNARRDRLTATLAPVGAAALPSYSEDAAKDRHAFLRRWDHAGDRNALGGALRIVESEPGVAGGWIDLEDGVQIWFEKGGLYRPGDYWLIPARTATGDVEWPDELDANGKPKKDADQNPVPAALPPHGPIHHYAPIMLVSALGGPVVIRDCRCRVEPLPCVPAAAPPAPPPTDLSPRRRPKG